MTSMMYPEVQGKGGGDAGRLSPVGVGANKWGRILSHQSYHGFGDLRGKDVRDAFARPLHGPLDNPTPTAQTNRISVDATNSRWVFQRMGQSFRGASALPPLPPHFGRPVKVVFLAQIIHGAPRHREGQ